jgi:hypothetical protein
MTKFLRFCQEQWGEFWRPAPADKPPADTSYDEVSSEQIQRMNEHAKPDYSKGKWVTETLEA